MEKYLTCIVCPRGCMISVKGEKEDLSVSGFACARGKEYAISECTHPCRTITAVVRIQNREDTMLSIKSAAPVPKEDIFRWMEKVQSCVWNAPVQMGEVLISDLFGSAVVATKTVI